MVGAGRVSWWTAACMVCLVACGGPMGAGPEPQQGGEEPGPLVPVPLPPEAPSTPSAPDADPPDAGTPDSGTQGAPDAGSSDGGAPGPDGGSPDAGPVDGGAPTRDGGETIWVQHRSPELDGNRSVRRVEALSHDAQGHVYAALAGEDYEGSVPRVLMMLEKLTPAGGLVWKRTFSVAPDGYWHSANFLQVAAAPAGHVFFGATVRGQVDFGAGPVGGTVLVRLSSDGRHVWTRRLGPNYDSALLRAIAVAPDGAVLVAGSFRGEVDFGGRTLSSADMASFVARYRADGSLDWVRAVDVPSTPGAAVPRTEVMSLAVDATGHVVVGGHFTLWLEPGNPESETRSGPVLMRWSPQGQQLWRKVLCESGDSIFGGSVYHVGVSARGTVVAAGSAHGLVHWAGETRDLRSPGDHGFLAVAEPEGSERFLRDFPGAFIEGLAVDPAGRAYLGGLGPARLDFGSGPTEDIDGVHPFVTRFNLDGAHVWGRVFVTQNPAQAWAGISSVTFLQGRGVVVGGQFYNPTDFGTGWIDPVFWDGFLVLLKP